MPSLSPLASGWSTGKPQPARRRPELDAVRCGGAGGPSFVSREAMHSREMALMASSLHRLGQQLRSAGKKLMTSKNPPCCSREACAMVGYWDNARHWRPPGLKTRKT